MLCIAGAASSALSAGEARSQTWTGAASDNNWFTPNNWTPLGPPVASGTTILDNGATPVLIGNPGALAYYLSIGNVAGSSGSLTVSGAGTLTTSDASNGLIVGDVGNGTLTISGGGTVNSQTAVLANYPDTTGVATVTGIGSSWTGAFFYIGADHSIGTLTVSDGGKLTASFVDIADFLPGGSSTLTVTDPGSSLVVNSGTFLVGNGAGDVGTFTVQNGASANVSGFLGIGSGSGSGALNVLSGATLTSANTSRVFVGSSTGSGTATVSGAGSTWNVNGPFSNDALDINSSAVNSSLSALAGGKVTIAPNASSTGLGGVSVGGVASAGTSSLIVDGASTFTAPNTFSVGAVDGAHGSVTVSGGGQLNTGYSVLAAGFGTTASSAQVLVTGTGSLWTVSDTAGAAPSDAEGLVIGQAGAGSLTIANGGVVQLANSASKVILGGYADSSAALNIGAPSGSAPAAPGTLGVGTVIFSTTTPALCPSTSITRRTPTCSPRRSPARPRRREHSRRDDDLHGQQHL